METRIASYQEPGIRLQLVKITKIINNNYPLIVKEICGGWLIKWSNGKLEPTTYENAKTTIKAYKMKENYETYEYIDAVKLSTETYKIIKNRRTVINIKWEGPARQKFAALIQQELLQTNIFSKYEEKKQ